MRTFKKAISALLTLAMILSMCTFGALATEAETVAKIGDNEYATLAEAISAAGAGDTITLQADVKTPDTATCYHITKNITLDLNGYELSGLANGGHEATHFIRVESGAVFTVADSSADKSGVISSTYRANSSLFVIEVNAGSKLVLTGGTVTNGEDVNFGCSCVYLRGTGALEMTGGKILAVKNPDVNKTCYALWVNSTNTKAEISDGTIATTGNGIKADAPLAISGGTFENGTFPGANYVTSGKYAVWADDTTCTVGGTPETYAAAITRGSTVEYFENVSTAAGKMKNGDLLTINEAGAGLSMDVPFKNTYNLAFSGSGSLAGTSAIAVAGTLAVTGEIPAGVVVSAAGYTLQSSQSDETVTYTAYVEDVNAAVKLVKPSGEYTNYLVLSHAVTDSVKDDTIRLIKDVDLGSGYLSLAKEITLDLNGCTLTSAHTGNLGAVELKTNSIHITDSSASGGGKIIHTAGNYGVYINGSGKTYTFENVTVEAENHGAVYVNGGIADIKSGAFSGEYGLYLRSLASVRATVSGGLFSGSASAIFKGEAAALSIIGGKFSHDPGAYVAAGYLAIGISEAPYLYTVAEKANPDVTVEVLAPVVAVPDTEGMDDDEKEAVEVAHAAIVGSDILASGLEAAAGSVAQSVATSAEDAASALTDAGVAVGDDDVQIYVLPYMDIQITGAETAEGDTTALTLEISPKYKVIASTAESADTIETDGDDKNAVEIGEAQPLEINIPVTITIQIPAGFSVDHVKHVKQNGDTYYYPVTIAEGPPKTATFTVLNGFSTFTLLSDERTATVDFDSTEQTFTATDVGTALPTASQAGYTFKGWTFEDIDGGPYLSLTDDLLTALYEAYDDAAITATAVFEATGGGWTPGPTTYTITIEDAENGKIEASVEAAAAGSIITLTAIADEGYVLDTLTVENGGAVTLTNKGGWKYTFTMPASAVTVTATFKEGSPLPFDDVDEDDWFYGDVLFVWENGLMKGVSEEPALFAPHGVTTRGMLVTILHRLESEPQSGTDNPFADVAAGSWYAEAVIWAAENGIVSGYGDGNFGPEDTLTREQMALILMNYAELKGYDVSGRADLSQFSDGDSVSDWAEEAVSWACAKSLIQGDGEKLNPAGNAERCQAAAILNRFLDNVAK